MSWNTQKVEDLKKLWNEGVATSRIGEQLGFTKNAVIGKAFRLGLERRQNSRKKTTPNQQLSSTTMYRETSVSAATQTTVKREVTRRRDMNFLVIRRKHRDSTVKINHLARQGAEY